MPQLKHIKPSREGLIVRDMTGARLPPEGKTLTYNVWWRKREAQGDVIVSDVKNTGNHGVQTKKGTK